MAHLISFIFSIKNRAHQEDSVRPYMKWSYELRAAQSAEGVFLRGLQIASTPPKGAVYITGAREIWDAPADSSGAEDATHWPAARMGGIPSDAARAIAQALAASKRPVVITSYLGRQ